MSDDVTDALIVAGGRGTRLQPLTHDQPKPLLPFCGPPFLEGLLRRLADAGVTRVFLVVGAETAPFARLVPAAERLGITLETVPEPQPLDTAGGVRDVATRLRAPYLVLNGDVLSDVDLVALVAAHRAAAAEATLLLMRVEDTSPFGVAVRDGTRIVRFVEKPAPGTLPGHDVVNAGAYVLEASVLDPYGPGPLSFEREVFPGLLERDGHLEGFVWDGVWTDLGTPERYLEGHRLALDGELHWPSLDDVPEIAPGVRVATTATVAGDLRAPVLVLDRAHVAEGAIVGPHAVLGAGAAVATRASVVASVLHDHVAVGRGVAVDRLIAGERSRVETGAQVGSGVVLGPGEQVEAGAVVPDAARRPPPSG